jgi:uncharacterized protein YbjT (DUF2867 family)
MTSPILVTGGTGTLGRRLVPRLRAAGRELRVLSRRPHAAEDGVRFLTGDLLTGEGIDAAVDGVAARLAELALGEAAGQVPDLGGARVYRAADLLRGYLRASRRRRPIVPVRLPGRAARSLRDGANLAPERAVGRRTWEEFLADRVGEAG